jgi:hypothetical protein
MLLQLNYKPADENGIYSTGFATAKSPNAYQSQQGIAEVITLNGPGLVNYTRDELHPEGLPLPALDPTRQCFTRCFRSNFPYAALSPCANKVEAFQAAFDAIVNRALKEQENNTFETVALYKKATPANEKTPLPKVPASDPCMTMTDEHIQSTPASAPSPVALDIIAQDSGDEDDDQDEDQAFKNFSVTNPSIASPQGKPKLQATLSPQAGSRSTGKRNKTTSIDRQDHSSAITQAAGPETKKAPAKRRLTKKIVVTNDSDEENVPDNEQVVV